MYVCMYVVIKRRRDRKGMNYRPLNAMAATHRLGV